MTATAALLGRPRYRVRYRTAPGGRLLSDVVISGKAPKITKNRVMGDLMVYTRQADGSVHVISVELVEDVLIEQSDRYGDWHQIGEWAP